MAVRGERAKVDFLGERKGVAVVTLGLLQGIAAGGDLAKEVQGPHFVTALAVLRGQGQGSPDECESVVGPPAGR